MCMYATAVEPYLPEPFCPKPTPLRQSVLPPPAVPGHTAPTMLIDSMQWGPGRGMRPPPPPYITSQPAMPMFDGGRGYSNDLGAVGRPPNLIVVPTRSEQHHAAGLRFCRL